MLCAIIYDVYYSWTFAQLNISIVSDPSYICEGNPVTLTANVTGGTQPYSYLWSNSSTSSSIVVFPTTSSNIYSVTVTDDNSITNSVQTDLFVDYVIIDSIQMTLIGDSINLSPVFHAFPSGTYTYLWNNGEQTPTIIVAPTTETIYCVTICNGGCTDSECISVEPTDLNELKYGFNFISIFPNPATYKIFIVNKSYLEKDFTVEMVNFYGQTLFSDQIILDNKYTIDVSYLDNGLYYLTLKNIKTFEKIKILILK